jgi:hypothetical protein
MSAAIRVADVIRCCWKTLNAARALPPHAARAARQILRCRTAALGGHLHACGQCGSQVPVYNSCQTRHCPTCQASARQKWLDARLGDVLPVQYFHVVFTLPHDLNALVDANRRLLLGELFATVNWVLQRFARDPQWRLEGQLGYLALLHTWTQRLTLHFHVHCLVPGGVWREKTGTWHPCRRKWLFRKDSLADAFRNRYLRRLESLRRRGKLSFSGRAAALAGPDAWDALTSSLRARRWIVFPKEVPASPQKALEYLARYTHKVAISDRRIKALENGQVTYTWRDRADGNREKTQTLGAGDFTMRFLSHILPEGFHKIRYHGWMSAANRKPVLAAIRRALGAEPPPPRCKEPVRERILRETGVDITLCPHCGKGSLRMTAVLIPRTRGHP